MNDAAQRTLRSILPRIAPSIIRLRARSGSGAIEQSRILRSILDSIAPTASGQSLGLGSLSKLRGRDLVDTFRRDVPLQRHADMQGFLRAASRGETDILFPGRAIALAQTSGTTSADDAGERYIPQNQALLDHHANGAVAALSKVVQRAGGAALRGRLLMLGGSTALVRNIWGVPVGDLSGITVDRIPWYLEDCYEPGRKIALEPDWNRKVEAIAERLETEDVTLVSGIPSWCLVLFEAVCRRRGVERVRDAWPGLRAFIHGGIGIDPYIPALREHLPRECLMQEVYPASEAFLAIGKTPWLLADGAAPDLEILGRHGVFIEFLPEGESDPQATVGPVSLEHGKVYRILVTTPGGLVRYEIGDLVEGRGPGLIRFAGRIRSRISAFGEHVESEKLVEAVSSACRETNSVISEFHVAPVFPTGSDHHGAHEWWIEFVRPPADLDRFAQRIDEYLRRFVLDYDAHRSGDAQLLMPTVRPLSRGTFQRSLASIGKLGGQHKIPVAWADRTWAERIAIHDTGEPV